MSKPRKFGMKSTYISNAKADMRRNKKVYQRSMEQAFRCQHQIPVDKKKAKC